MLVEAMLFGVIPTTVNVVRIHKRPMIGVMEGIKHLETKMRRIKYLKKQRGSQGGLVIQHSGN